MMSDPTLTTTTPAGLRIDFYAAPRRHYTITKDDVTAEAISVTDALGCLDKPGLPWWGMKVGIEGVKALDDLGVFATLPMWTTDAVIGLLTEHKLTVNHVRDKAAQRGTNVHDAFDRYAVTGELPNPDDFEAEQKQYVVGLRAFLETVDGCYEPEDTEVLVGSNEYLYAGRYDQRARFTKPVTLVTKTYPKRGPKVTEVPPGAFLLDLKTSAGVYESHAIQLGAYEGASVESGYDPTDYRVVLRVTNDGRYEFRRVLATQQDFLAVLAVSRLIDRVKEELKV